MLTVEFWPAREGSHAALSEFVRGKRIKLVSASDLATLGETAEGNTLDLTYSPPICPVAGCGKEIVLRKVRDDRMERADGQE